MVLEEILPEVGVREARESSDEVSNAHKYGSSCLLHPRQAIFHGLLLHASYFSPLTSLSHPYIPPSCFNPSIPPLQDLHPPQVLSALKSQATHILQLQPLSPLQRQLLATATGVNPHGQIRCCSRRARSGRLRVEQQCYSLSPGGGLVVLQPLAGFKVEVAALVNGQGSKEQRQKQEGVATGAAGGGKGLGGGPGTAEQQQQQQPSRAGGLSGQIGSMRLGVSEQVREGTEEEREGGGVGMEGGRAQESACGQS